MYLKILIVFTLILWTGCAPDIPPEKEKEDRGRPVMIEPVLKDLGPPRVFLSGRLHAGSELPLSFKVGGYIRSIEVKEGQQVDKGMVLAKLDRDEISAMASKAETALQKAKRDLERAKKLAADSIISTEQLQNAKTALEVAQADYTSANYNLRHTVIRAPQQGKILRVPAEAGQLTGPGSPVIYFGGLGKGWTVTGSAADRDALDLLPGDSAVVHFTALPDTVFPGVVLEIAGSADPITGTFSVEVTLTESHDKFRSGLIAEMIIKPGSRQDAIWIPVEALIPHGDKTAIWKPVGEKAERVEVRPQVIRNSLAAITQGLEDVDSVITKGAYYLEPGDRIKRMGAQ